MNGFTICSLFYAILLNVICFTKQKIQTIENRIFDKIMFTNLIGASLATGCYFTISYSKQLPILNEIISKGYIVYLLTWITLFSIYIFTISIDDKENKKQKYAKIEKIFGLFYLVVLAVVIFTPLYYFNEDGIVYSYGPCANVVYGVSFVLILAWVIRLLKNIKKIKSKKYLPIFVYMFLGTIVVIIQRINPGLLLMTAMETFITFLMYFTIENPDVTMLNELYKNKELMEQNYEDKYNFLFEMTQEARNPLVNINSLCNEMRNEENIVKIKNDLMEMNSLVKQLDFSINNILNISSLDIQKIKIVNNKYDLEKICNDLVIKIKPEIKANVQFNIELPKQIPILFGDHMKIRQILYSLLMNACKNTVNGNINLKVNLIEKYDVCRVIFNISDTGSGMPIEKINEILSATGELNKQELENLETREYNIKVCQKVMKFMGGNLMIKSKIGKGTDVILTIDQRVYQEKQNSVLSQFENEIKTYKKVLIVSQNKDINNFIKKKLSEHKIAYSNLYYGADAIDKIKNNQKFDYILVEDEMKEMSGFMTMKGMKEIKNFKTPIIVMLQEDKEKLKKHFIEDGFTDYLLINNIESELERIIEKY